MFSLTWLRKITQKPHISIYRINYGDIQGLDYKIEPAIEYWRISCHKIFPVVPQMHWVPLLIWLCLCLGRALCLDTQIPFFLACSDLGAPSPGGLSHYLRQGRTPLCAAQTIFPCHSLSTPTHWTPVVNSSGSLTGLWVSWSQWFCLLPVFIFCIQNNFCLFWARH